LSGEGFKKNSEKGGTGQGAEKPGEGRGKKRGNGTQKLLAIYRSGGKLVRTAQKKNGWNRLRQKKNFKVRFLGGGPQQRKTEDVGPSHLVKNGQGV